MKRFETLPNLPTNHGISLNMDTYMYVCLTWNMANMLTMKIVESVAERACYMKNMKLVNNMTYCSC